MRNLKKFLALVLAMVMAFSLMLSANAAYGDYDKYADKDSITEGFEEAVAVLTGLDVLKGDEQGGVQSFRPASTLTRAEAAVIVYRVATGDVTDQQTALYADYNHFSDVSKDDWFAGYVGFCQNAGYIKGTSPSTFSPYGTVSGYQLLAMLLRVVGYGQNNEFTGSNWQVKVAALAEQLHITDSVKEANFTSTLNMNARRDVVAELTFVTLTTVPTVTYTPALSYSDREVLTESGKNPTLGQKIFGLWNSIDRKDNSSDYYETIDNWGRPGYYWLKNGKDTGADQPNTQLPIYRGSYAYGTDPEGNVVATIAYDVAASYHTRVSECQIAEDTGMASMNTDKLYLEGVYIDGVRVPVDAEAATTAKDGNIGLYETSSFVGGNGRILEVYMVPSSNSTVGYRLVEINTYLAEVKSVTEASFDKNNHEIEGYITLDVYAKGIDRADSLDSKGDYVYDNTKTTYNGILKDTTNDNKATALTGYLKDTNFAVGDWVLVTASEQSWLRDTFQKTDGGQRGQLLESAVKANVVTGGEVTTYTIGNSASNTNGTTTVGNGATAQTYQDADKFVLGRRLNNEQPLNVALDEYGNIIGRVGTAQYLVIEKIEWKHSADSIGNGYALADVVYINGSKQSNVKVTYVNNDAVTNCSDSYGLPGRIVDTSSGVPVTTKTAGTVSDYYQNNFNYYGHIFSYSVNSDGTYNLSTKTDDANGYMDHGRSNPSDFISDSGYSLVPDPVNPSNNIGQWAATGTATITRGQATITVTGTYTSDINKYVATDNTVFMVLNSDGYTYTTYTGKNNVPSMQQVNVCVLLNSSNYAQVVVVNGRNVTNRHFMAFIPCQAPLMETSAKGRGYNVYELGSTSARMVYEDLNNQLINAVVSNVPNATDPTATGTGAGFYEIEVDSNEKVIGIWPMFMNDDSTNAGGTVSGGVYTAEYVLNSNDPVDTTGFTNISAKSTSPSTTANLLKGKLRVAASGNSFQIEDFNTPSNQVVDFNMTGDTKVIVLKSSKYWASGAPVSVSSGSLGASYAGKPVIVECESSGTNTTTRYNAKTVYVIDTSIESAVRTHRTTADWDLRVNGSNVRVGFDAYQTLTAAPTAAELNALLAYAVANPVVGNEFAINSYGRVNTLDVWSTTSSLSSYGIRVFQSKAEIPSSLPVSSFATVSPEPGAGGTPAATSSLQAGNWIVVMTVDSAGLIGYSVFEVR